MSQNLASRALRVLSAASLAALVTAGVAGTANAAGCPADKLVAPGMGQPKSDVAAVGVTDDVIASIDVAKEPAAIHGRLFRLRKLVVQPGGVVPWHSHGDRPAIIYIISGEITEYASNCAVPIVHRAGESTAETHLTAHWWKNTGSETVVLLSADLFPTAGHDQHMM